MWNLFRDIYLQLCVLRLGGVALRAGLVDEVDGDVIKVVRMCKRSGGFGVTLREADQTGGQVAVRRRLEVAKYSGKNCRV